MNSMSKFKPWIVRFSQQLLNRGLHLHKFGNITRLRTNGETKVNIMMIYAALPVLWPFSKSNQLAGELQSDKKPSVLYIADQLFENGQYEKCLQLLNSSEDHDHVEVQWRICRALYNMSKECKYDKKDKKKLIYQAFNIISNQLNDNKDHFAVHKWYALLLDAKSSYEGTKARIEQLENVKNHMDLAVTLNPKDATVLHMLGEWCYQITELPWQHRKIAEIFFATPPQSTYEDALEYFLGAEAVQPRFYSLNLLRIGMCYMKLNKLDHAKYYLKLAASYPAKSNDDHEANKTAAEYLKKLK